MGGAPEWGWDPQSAAHRTAPGWDLTQPTGRRRLSPGTLGSDSPRPPTNWELGHSDTPCTCLLPWDRRAETVMAEQARDKPGLSVRQCQPTEAPSW